MAVAGEVIENPVTGEKMIFEQTGTETQGELLKFEMQVKPQGFVPAEHIHPAQTEHFQVESGELHLRKGGEERVYQAGEEASIPPGTAHMWWNDADKPLQVTIEFRPADRFDHFLVSLFALARDGKTDEKGMPGLLQTAVLIQAYDDVIYPSSPPRWLQKVLFGLLAPLGRLLGYRADYPYSE